MKTDCSSFLKQQIAVDGPLPVDRFMQICLSDPKLGYYARQDRFGQAGDFITAPEISQLFGEMMASFLAYLWQASGSPAPTDMVRFEAGPGRGTLYQDMHKTYEKICPALSLASPFFIEASPYLRSRIAQAVAPNTPCFIEEITELPSLPLFGIANEFFDALGVKQICFTGGRWHWRVLDVEAGELKLAVGQPLTAVELSAIAKPPQPQEGDICEISPLSEDIMKNLSQHIAQFGGGFLICDYGKLDNFGDSLQAVKAHAKTDILATPGECDISHLVDFSALKRQAEEVGARLIGPVEQGSFLTELGIKERAEALRKPGQPEADRMLLAALDRLTAPSHMGQIFKIALLVPNGSGYPPGFATATA